MLSLGEKTFRNLRGGETINDQRLSSGTTFGARRRTRRAKKPMGFSRQDDRKDYEILSKRKEARTAHLSVGHIPSGRKKGLKGKLP